jgi:hypothetical protein
MSKSESVVELLESGASFTYVGKTPFLFRVHMIVAKLCESFMIVVRYLRLLSINVWLRHRFVARPFMYQFFGHVWTILITNNEFYAVDCCMLVYLMS